MNQFLKWMKNSATDEKTTVAEMAGTSLHQLRLMQYAMEGKENGRQASAELAGRVEQAIAKLAKRPRYKALPVVTRGDICPACADCPYMKACKK